MISLTKTNFICIEIKFKAKGDVLVGSSEEVLVGVGIHGESDPGDGGVGKSRCDEDGSVDGVHGCGSLKARSKRSPTMNAIYTAVLVASTLAYSAVAWIGLSMDANEDLF
ncbi:hypothetical protein B9Z55_017024 [Caenorhabditis nigoni]|uniref:Uncharacterized protein n=1 Tax=Caenorhabditis nigoni TaxID=1611254 RepID=A0A2G5T791_9PELO|nr:hypothetical protein B9Z55_017024 [Caenorhabditis nigoni]